MGSELLLTGGPRTLPALGRQRRVQNSGAGSSLEREAEKPRPNLSGVVPCSQRVQPAD